MTRPDLRTSLYILLLLVLPLIIGVASAASRLPESWASESREPRLHEEGPSASELEVRRTTLKGADGRGWMKQRDDNLLLLLETMEDLKPGEHLALSVDYQDGKRLELTLVRGELRTDLGVLETFEKDGGPRRIRVKDMTFEPPVQDL